MERVAQSVRRRRRLLSRRTDRARGNPSRYADPAFGRSSLRGPKGRRRDSRQVGATVRNGKNRNLLTPRKLTQSEVLPLQKAQGRRMSPRRYVLSYRRWFQIRV